MGCDIHLTLETKVKDKWIMVNRLTDYNKVKGRNYRRFAALAGVRGDGPDALGIPEDVSESTQLAIDEWGVDGHSHSYMDVVDALPIFKETEYDREGPNERDLMLPYYYYFDINESNIKPDMYRIVFWFDN